MKTTKALLMVLASSRLLSAEDYSGLSGKTYRSDAPDGRFSVHAHQEKGYYKCEVELRDLVSGAPLLTFEPPCKM